MNFTGIFSASFATFSSVMTLISMFVFIGILLWAFSAKNKKRFEEAAKLEADYEMGEK